MGATIREVGKADSAAGASGDDKLKEQTTRKGRGKKRSEERASRRGQNR